MRYELYYWPSIQGRGEFVRLALEEAGADYVDVARGSKKATGGMPAMLRLLDGKVIERPPLAPPILKAGALLIGQTATILEFRRGRASKPTWPRIAAFPSTRRASSGITTSSMPRPDVAFRAGETREASMTHASRSAILVVAIPARS